MSQAELVTQTFNGLAEWSIEGRYFKLMAAAANVRVELFKSGRTVLIAPSVTAGFYQFVEFDSVKITTGSAIAVTFLAAPAEGGSDTVTGAFDMTDDPARQMGIAYGTLGQLAQKLMGGVNALEVTERGIDYGVAFKSTTVLAANVSEQVFAPGSNTNGAIIHRASAFGGQVTGVPQYGLIAHTAAPNGFAAGDVIATGSVVYVNTTFVTTFLLERPILIAAGKGLYWNTSILEAVALRTCLYTLLP